MTNVDLLEKTARFEHRFWLQILGDHSRFILEALAPIEQDNIKTASEFIQIFDALLNKVNSEEPVKLSTIAEEETLKLREFKLGLLEKHLLGKVKVHLPPTFFNHMVNELDEYVRLLGYFKSNQIPPVFHELHYHLVWLLDAAGHASAISSNLDQVEAQLIEKSDQFMKKFEHYYLKAVEFAGYLRTNLSTYPALEKMNLDVSLEMKLFQSFLHELKELELSSKVLGTFSPLMADHMFREECYFLTKFLESVNLEKPDCDPTKPRVQEGQ
jgi:hypothetical protein